MKKREASTSSVRIIGGALRSRKVSFLARDGLRPTPDRVRETLFNWLQQDIAGSRGLDLFAGTGALGFEALSRGAASLLFVDSDALVCRSIEQNIESLGCNTARVLHADALSCWREPALGRGFDIVFLDPPFQSADYAAIARQLTAADVLRCGSKIYIESAQPVSQCVPESWQEYRSKRAGKVHFALYHYAGTAAEQGNAEGQ